MDKQHAPSQLLTFTVLFAKDGDEYVAFCPALNGLATQGRTLDEAREMVKDAMLLHLEGLHEDGLPIPHDRDATAEELADIVPASPIKEKLALSLVPA